MLAPWRKSYDQPRQHYYTGGTVSGKNTGVGCHFLLQCMKVKSESEVTQLCPTLSDPMDCSPPGSAIHGIFQARVLEWGAIASPITSWQIDGETMETLTDFISLGSKITEDGDCSREIKRCLVPGRKAMTNLDSIIKMQRHHFANRDLSSQSYGFSNSHVWM